MPNVRKDGLEVVFASTRPGGHGSFDIWSDDDGTIALIRFPIAAE